MDAYMGMIMPWAGSYAPVGWHFCDGTLLQINSNPALFAVIGVAYGGDGRATFGLPDLRCRVPMGMANSTPPWPHTSYSLGQTGGVETNTLSQSQMPIHAHDNTLAVAASNVSVNVAIPAVQGVNANAIKPSPTMSLGKGTGEYQYSDAATDTTMKPFNASGSVTPSVTLTNAAAGGNSAVENRPPFQVINYIICVQGIFPPRN